jgi:putative FmdB family regulatory protein
MPIYEYKCQACGKHLEELQKFNDPVLWVCPFCGKSSLTRLISSTSFQLKGGGYYATDYKDKKPEEKKQEDKIEKKEPSETSPKTTEAEKGSSKTKKESTKKDSKDN